MKFDYRYIQIDGISPKNISKKIVEYTIDQIEALIEKCDIGEANALIIHDIEYLYIVNRLIRDIKIYDSMLYNKMFSSGNNIDIHLIKSVLNDKKIVHKKIRHSLPNIFESGSNSDEEIDDKNKWKYLFSYSPNDNNEL